MSRALKLYWLSGMEVLHRLRYDWAREIVVFLASLILFATFLYVFNDFLNVQVSSLSQAMRDRFAEVLAVVALACGTAAATASLRRERLSDQSLERTAKAFGEEPTVTRRFVVLRSVTAVAIVHGLTWLLVVKTMVVLTPRMTVAVEALMAAVTFGIAFLVPPRPSTKGAAGTQTEKHATSRPLVTTLVRWRLSQILGRNRLTRLTLGIASALLVLLGTVASGAPTFACIALSLAAGYVTSLALVFQVADDLPGVWTERGLGVTHDQYVQAYERLGAMLGLAAGAIAAALFMMGRALGSMPFDAGVLNDAAKVLVVTATPAFIFAWIMMQIDGRRAGVNAVLILIAGLFLGTAIYAHWLSLLLLIILRYYALGSQAGRFYRA